MDGLRNGDARKWTSRVPGNDDRGNADRSCSGWGASDFSDMSCWDCGDSIDTHAHDGGGGDNLRWPRRTIILIRLVRVHSVVPYTSNYGNSEHSS